MPFMDRSRCMRDNNAAKTAFYCSPGWDLQARDSALMAGGRVADHGSDCVLNVQDNYNRRRVTMLEQLYVLLYYDSKHGVYRIRKVRAVIDCWSIGSIIVCNSLQPADSCATAADALMPAAPRLHERVNTRVVLSRQLLARAKAAGAHDLAQALAAWAVTALHTAAAHAVATCEVPCPLQCWVTKR